MKLDYRDRIRKNFLKKAIETEKRLLRYYTENKLREILDRNEPDGSFVMSIAETYHDAIESAKKRRQMQGL